MDIELNYKKTKITPYRAKKAGISKQLNDIQSKVSGPMDLEQTNDIVSELEVLLSMTTSDIPEQEANNCLINNLANIERNTFDVREDILRRFTANQLAKRLNEIDILLHVKLTILETQFQEIGITYKKELHDG